MTNSEPNPIETQQTPETLPASVSASDALPPLQGQHLPPGRAEISEVSLELRRHSGPLPSPDDYRQYAAIIPNGAERLMKMAEKQQEHSHTMELKQENRATFGVISAVTSVICAVALSGYGFYTGHPIEALGVFGVTLGTVVTVFIRGTSTSSASPTENQKAEENPD